MNSLQLYHQLIERGVKFTINGELLTFAAPKGALTPDLLALMKRYKQDLIRIVKSENIVETATVKQHAASLGQEALWLLHQNNPKSASYNTAAALQILSTIDLDALQRAMLKLQSRHESLRTTFSQRGTEIIAEVHTQPAVDLKVLDAAGLSDDDLRVRVQDEYSQPFDLQTGPLFRVRVFEQSKEAYVLLMVFHHIIFDASSLWVLQSELQQLYHAEKTGTAGLLPALNVTYSDFVKWQRELPHTEIGETQWKYWQAQLEGDPAPGELPWSFPRHRLGERDGATCSVHLDQELSSAIRQLAKSLGATPFATTLAAFQALVFRYSGQRDFVVGTTTSGRSQHQFASSLGYFVNILPIRGKVHGALTFAELVQQTKQRALGALQNGDFPFAELVKRLNPVRTSNAPPLCRMMFGMQKPHAFAEVSQLLECDEQCIEWGSLKARAYQMHQQEGQFDLTVELYEGSKSYSCILKYDRNLLSDAAAERCLQHYVMLLRGIVADPHLPVDSYTILTDDEAQQIAAWSRGPALVAAQAPREERMDRLFEQNASKFGLRTALLFEDESWTYAELDAWVNQVASEFRRQGVTVGDRVVCSIRRHPLAPVVLLAAMKCGAAYVPVAADSPAQRFSKIVTECQPRLVIADEFKLSSLQELVPPTTKLMARESAEFAYKPTDDAAAQTSFNSESFSPDVAAYVIYTSGSSGVPKGVQVSQRAIAQHVVAMAQVYATQPEDRVLQFCDLTFDPSIEQLLVPWSVGASVVMRPETMYTGDGFWREVVAKEITIANLPPSFFTECSSYVVPNTHLRLMIVGGDVFPNQVINKWRAVDVRLLNAYGPTEAVITATVYDVQNDDANRRIPIGRPMPNSQAWILDASGMPTPVGVPGELCLGGTMLADGYIGNAGELQNRFQVVALPDGQVGRIYRTGDYARWTDEGQIEFLGRLDRQIKIRGFRVEPGEIEAALLEIPCVNQASVKLCEEGATPYLAAYVIPHAGFEVSRDDLKRQLRSRLPSYMVPERIGFVENWPLNDSGKVALDRLPVLPKPQPSSSLAFVAPRCPLEKVICQIWQEVLEVDRVGIHDDFYQLGGGSLQSLRIISRLRELGVSPAEAETEMSPHLLFQYVTIAELSPLLRLAPQPDSAASAPFLGNPSVIAT